MSFGSMSCMARATPPRASAAHRCCPDLSHHNIFKCQLASPLHRVSSILQSHIPAAASKLVTAVYLQERVQVHALVVSYEMAMAEIMELRRLQWGVMVVDEGHRLKDPKSRLFKVPASVLPHCLVRPKPGTASARALLPSPASYIAAISCIKDDDVACGCHDTS